MWWILIRITYAEEISCEIQTDNEIFITRRHNFLVGKFAKHARKNFWWNFPWTFFLCLILTFDKKLIKLRNLLLKQYLTILC